MFSCAMVIAWSPIWYILSLSSLSACFLPALTSSALLQYRLRVRTRTAPTQLLVFTVMNALGGVAHDRGQEAALGLLLEVSELQPSEVVLIVQRMPRYGARRFRLEYRPPGFRTHLLCLQFLFDHERIGVIHNHPSTIGLLIRCVSEGILIEPFAQLFEVEWFGRQVAEPGDWGQLCFTLAGSGFPLTARRLGAVQLQ